MFGDGAGFYRFPAWAGMKPNDVSPGHVARMFSAPNVQMLGITLVITAAPLLVDPDFRAP
jgi:hypothetical protein